MDFTQLLDDYRKGKLTAQQRAAFEELLHGPDAEQQLQQLVDQSLKHVRPVDTEETQKFVYERIKEQHFTEHTEEPVSVVPLHRNAWFRYAAMIAMLIGLGTYLLIRPSSKPSDQVATVILDQVQTDVAPGHDGAILVLADGSEVKLDSLSNGVIATQKGTQVLLKNGTLAYDPQGQDEGEMTYNTMRTPKGRQFQLLLPDGSKVWLNAASSITYPTTFKKNERQVEVSGEAYFEVVKNAKAPFKVKVNTGTEIEVLGTSFNINSYEDESAVKTTLLEGSVRIRSESQQKVMKPGEQAQVNAGKGIRIIPDADLDQVMAWKNGLFNFNGYDIASVMRELGRWYDLDIVFEGEPEAGEVMGEMQRNLTLSQVMKILRKLNIHYRIEGKKLIVMQ